MVIGIRFELGNCAQLSCYKITTQAKYSKPNKGGAVYEPPFRFAASRGARSGPTAQTWSCPMVVILGQSGVFEYTLFNLFKSSLSKIIIVVLFLRTSPFDPLME